MRNVLAALLFLLAIAALMFGETALDGGSLRLASGFFTVGYLALGAGVIAMIYALDRNRNIIDPKTGRMIPRPVPPLDRR